MSLRDDLLRPASYPAPEPPAIELRETHISWVFLAGSEVFKVKKPVNFGFLDFSTIELRKQACDAEVELNARLAPDAYLGVVPVRRGEDGRACLHGDGAILDWAVRMVRLPDALRADIKLAAGSLAERDIDAIAGHIAAFHAGARADAETARFGSREAVGASVRENFEQTRDVIARYLTPDEASAIERWQTSFLDEHGTLFDERIRAGRVRDGHGDLRLEHVYIEPTGRLTVLDCIEFNARFRFADVCADIAFLSMDLAWHGRVDLAERLLATYARESGDYDLYSVADFYESYRAYVRAKVATMLARDGDAEEALRHRAAEEARRYFLLALSMPKRPVLPPMLVAVGGIIASGKSTLAGRVGAALSAPVVEADRTRKQMLGVRPTERVNDPAWQGAYNPDFTTKVYAEVLRRADVVLASGRPVVVDASFRSESMRRAARDLAERHGVPFRVVECRVPPDACRARLAKREQEEGHVSDGRLAIFDDFCARFEPMTELAPAEHLVIDTSGPMEATLAALDRQLVTWPRGLVA